VRVHAGGEWSDSGAVAKKKPSPEPLLLKEEPRKQWPRHQKRGALPVFFGQSEQSGYQRTPSNWPHGGEAILNPDILTKEGGQTAQKHSADTGEKTSAKGELKARIALFLRKRDGGKNVFTQLRDASKVTESEWGWAEKAGIGLVGYRPKKRIRVSRELFRRKTMSKQKSVFPA